MQRGLVVRMNFRQILQQDDAGPVIRRFFINTLFDSTFMLLGVIVGAAFSTVPDPEVILVTMVTSSAALGISSGVSVYEAESLERERKIADLEKALFRDLANTTLERTGKAFAYLVATINMLTPLTSCFITVTPFILSILDLITFSTAAWVSVLLGLSVLFVAGVYMGREGKHNPALRGARMVGFGLIAFAIGLLLKMLI